MMQVTKNISMGSPIKNVIELKRLADEKKSVVVFCGGSYFVRPASFMIQWPLAQLLQTSIFYSIKSINKTN